MKHRCRKTARQLLQHYFALFAERSEIEWTEDNREEVDQLVDCLIEAAKEEIRESSP